MVLGPVAISDSIYWIGVDDEIKELFESLWPLPFGISYNAYAVIGSDAVALIDTVDERYTYEYLGKVKEVVKDFDRIRYIVINHLEPDHHGATPHVLDVMPQTKVVTTPIGSKILKSIYRIPEGRIHIVRDSDRITLGGKTLRFIYTPWLHWPETMVTYIEEDRILFSCDAFGSYGALRTNIFDDELDMDFYLEEARRYFSNIVIKYTKNVMETLEKLKNLEIKVLAPSHGPIYRSNINRIIELYRKWSKPELEKDRVVLVYGSMYGRSETIVEKISRELGNVGIKLIVHDVSLSHTSYILSDVVEAYVVIAVYPSYDSGIFPYMENLLSLFQLKQIGKGRSIAIVNTYSWTPTARYAVDLATKAGFKIIEPIVETKSIPDQDELKKLEILIQNILKEIGT